MGAKPWGPTSIFMLLNQMVIYIPLILSIVQLYALSFFSNKNSLALQGLPHAFVYSYHMGILHNCPTNCFRENTTHNNNNNKGPFETV